MDNRAGGIGTAPFLCGFASHLHGYSKIPPFRQSTPALTALEYLVLDQIDPAARFALAERKAHGEIVWTENPDAVQCCRYRRPTGGLRTKTRGLVGNVRHLDVRAVHLKCHFASGHHRSAIRARDMFRTPVGNPKVSGGINDEGGDHRSRAVSWSQLARLLIENFVRCRRLNAMLLPSQTTEMIRSNVLIEACGHGT